jgi:peptidoglycan/LPS O-acetylase OafA/YrhL
VRIRPTWVLTVCSASTSVSAISPLGRPRAISLATSSSRAVRLASWPGRGRSRRGWLARRRPWIAVIAVGSMAMTLYLWHLPAMATLYRLVLAVDGPLPNPGTGAWGATRPLWLALLAAVLAPLALALSRFERPRRPGASPAPTLETRSGHVAAVLGVVLHLAVAALAVLNSRGGLPMSPRPARTTMEV